MSDLSIYRKSFPLAAGADAHWTDSVVTEGHVAACREYGHATWTEDGVTRAQCPRCGESTAPRVPAIITELHEESIDPRRPYLVTDADTDRVIARGVTYSHALNVVYSAHGSYRVTSLIGGSTEVFHYGPARV